MQEYLTHTPEETQAVARQLVTTLMGASGVRGTSTIIALQGDLGAGKTVFVKGIADMLGVRDVVTSPTYVIEKVYSLPEGSHWKHVVHIDAYRLQGEEELHTIGWNDIATDPGNLICMEWPEQVGIAVPERAVWVTIHQENDTTRRIVVSESLPLV